MPAAEPTISRKADFSSLRQGAGTTRQNILAVGCSAQNQSLNFASAVQHGEDQNHPPAYLKKYAVGKPAQSHAPDIFKADDKVMGIFSGGEHGVARLVNEPDGYSRIALVIPESGLLHITVNERMLDQGVHRRVYASTVQTIRR